MSDVIVALWWSAVVTAACWRAVQAWLALEQEREERRARWARYRRWRAAETARRAGVGEGRGE